MKKQIINVVESPVSILTKDKQDYISLTDIARFKDAERSDYILQNWMRLRSTIEFIGLWEVLHNPNFNSIEFDGIKTQAGANSFSLTPKRWIQATGATGMISSAGRYGGSYAHKDIAFEFASWISAEFKLYLIIEFQRLKSDENDRLKLEWNLQRTLAKVNYKIHTDAIKATLIPPELSKKQTQIVYANEADILNMALFGRTAKQWRHANPKSRGNIRDVASLEQLVVLSNLESINSVLIGQGLGQDKRLIELNKVAISQMKSLLENKHIKRLK